MIIIFFCKKKQRNVVAHELSFYLTTWSSLSFCAFFLHFYGKYFEESPNIGWSIKRFSIKVKKKCTKKGRWPRRKIKTCVHVKQHHGVSFYKKEISYRDLFSSFWCNLFPTIILILPYIYTRTYVSNARSAVSVNKKKNR